MIINILDKIFILILTVIILFFVFVLLFKKNICKLSKNTEKIIHQDTTREYLIFKPDSYNKDKRYPLILNFHGYGDKVENYQNTTEMKKYVNEYDFILVYPQGSCKSNEKVPHWNSSEASSDNKSQADDLGFIKILIEKINSEYSIDEEKIYAVGYSNGSFFSYFLACNNSKIRGIASISGSMSKEQEYDTDNKFKILIIHGKKDQVIPYDGNKDLLSIPEVINTWKDKYKIENEKTISNTYKNGNVIHEIYYDENDIKWIENYSLLQGDHDHNWKDSINDNGEDTSKVILNFFNLIKE